MRHRLRHRKLNRTSEHRRALQRNQAQSLFEHGMVRTTLPKAKNLQPFCERLITLAVRVRKHRVANEPHRALNARRRIHRLMGDRSLVPADHQADYEGLSDAARNRTLRMVSGRRHRTGEPKGRLAYTGESVTHRLIERVASRFLDRPGGYTRLICLPDRRIGDGSVQAVLQLLGDEEPPGAVAKPARSARKRRADARYALAVKLAKADGGTSVKGRSPSDTASDSPAGDDVAGELPVNDAGPETGAPDGD